MATVSVTRHFGDQNQERPQLPAHASLHVQSLVAGVPAPLPAPILVPLPSARARGLKYEAFAGSDALDTDEVARRDAEADRLLAEQKRKDLERLERELANHQLTSANLPPKSPSREKFSFLNLRRGLSSSAPPTPTSLPQILPDQPPPIPVSPNSPVGGVFNRPPTSYSSSRTQPGLESSHTPSQASDNLPMGAPSSAPGCGADQSITIRCRQFTAVVNTTLETTVGDALDAAAKLLPRHTDFTSCALIESYTRLGLERRLRRYERIRDIHNSWDSGNDNCLSILLPEASTAAMHATERSPRETKSLLLKSKNFRDATESSASASIGRNGHATDLDLPAVSRSRTTPPPGFTYFSMYHSQKPGRWNKRYITLVEKTGQLVASKKADESRVVFLSAEAKSNVNNSPSGDFQSLCHLSDYDIYTPTEAQMRKHLRPPKAHCFALKSQQRTTVFLNTENYVHFISTDEPSIALLFYNRVFAWRSWYLVNRQLALPRTTKANALPPVSMQTPSYPPSSSATVHKQIPRRSLSKSSAGTTPRSDSARISKTGSLFGGIGDSDLTLDFDRRDPSKPATVMSGTSSRTLSLRANAQSSTFAPGGLLGNGYDDRKRTEFSGASDRHHHGQPRNIVSSTAAAAALDSSWFPSASDHSARQRSKSIRDAAPPPVLTKSLQSNDDIPLGLQFPQYIQKQQTVGKRVGREVGISRSLSVGRPAANPVAVLAPPMPSMPSRVPAMPAPLIDLTPKFQEAPQWSKEGKGHGVRAPAGTAHLVDLATDWNSRLPNNGSRMVGGVVSPPCNTKLLRRDQATDVSADQNSTGMSTQRSQTMTTSSAAVATSFSRTRSLASHARPSRVQAPPVPLVQCIPNSLPFQEGNQVVSRH
ncbi:hypothetical protein SEPCBS57363_004725 [Sporothrix epigloea]|uniref:PH domain-containing protein n=1 Tax=Sporothrix epigloea TaxID=1892477 RepID=A0ABP0DXI6_9PEZI